MTGLNLRMKPHRPTPKMATTNYKTFRVMSPISTHFRPATCEEFKCKAFNEGWTYRKADLERENLLYAVTHAGKRYREMAAEDGVHLVFEPGQSCFQAPTHRVPLDRPEFYFAGRGDWRSFSHRKAQVFTRPDDWVDSFATHLDWLNNEIQKG